MVPVAQGNKGLTACVWSRSRARTGQWYTVQKAQPHHRTQVPTRIVHSPPCSLCHHHRRHGWSPLLCHHHRRRDHPHFLSGFSHQTEETVGWCPGQGHLVSRNSAAQITRRFIIENPHEVQPASHRQTGRPSGRELSASLRPRRLSSPTDCPLSATSFCAH